MARRRQQQNVSHAQVLQRILSTGSEVTTPGVNPMCDPNDRHVNTRESHVCGLPKTPSATAEPTTTESPSFISPTSPTRNYVSSIASKYSNCFMYSTTLSRYSSLVGL